jgi:hypothetical protein
MIVQSRTCETCRQPIESKGLLHIWRVLPVRNTQAVSVIPIIFTTFSRSVVFMSWECRKV